MLVFELTRSLRYMCERDEGFGEDQAECARRRTPVKTLRTRGNLGISEFIRHSEDDPGMHREIRDSEEVGISSKL